MIVSAACACKYLHTILLALVSNKGMLLVADKQTCSSGHWRLLWLRLPKGLLTDSFGKETVSCILLPSNFFFGGGESG